MRCCSGSTLPQAWECWSEVLRQDRAGCSRRPAVSDRSPDRRRSSGDGTGRAAAELLTFTPVSGAEASSAIACRVCIGPITCVFRSIWILRAAMPGLERGGRDDGGGPVRRDSVASPAAVVRDRPPEPGPPAAGACAGRLPCKPPAKADCCSSPATSVAGSAGSLPRAVHQRKFIALRGDRDSGIGVGMRLQQPNHEGHLFLRASVDAAVGQSQACGTPGTW